MAIVRAHLDEPRDQAAARLRQAAADQGWSVLEGNSGDGQLVFRKGASAFSWGSQITAGFDGQPDSETRLVFTTKESFAITDWGRGRRQVRKLLAALGAETD
jgi:hypothetical protein